ncbi:MAG: hypothetical protein HYZ42_13850, partial [Bacteroidetes bacterium]|nr:hypothetical protein [Bacteroidota bacterium]
MIQKQSIHLFRYNKLTNKLLCLVLFLNTFNFSLFAQKPISIDHASLEYFRALELFTKQKYNAAASIFQQYINKQPQSLFIVDAKFYKSVCDFELFHPNAKQEFEEIYNRYAHHIRANQSAFYIGKILFRDKKYKEINNQLAKVDLSLLESVEESEYWFIKGFSLYKINAFDESKEALANISLDSNKYYFDANYYKGYIHYTKSEYSLAEQCFKRVLSHPYYSQVVPLYLAQIYVKQNKYTEALEITDTVS